MTLSYNATLIARADLTDSLATFTIKPDRSVVNRESSEPGFFAGQYVTLGLNAARSAQVAKSTLRAMSIASGPDADAPLEFFIRRVEHPTSALPFTHLLWGLDVGERLYLKPVALGHFTIEHTIGLDDARTKILIAAGTGIAPFMSMLRARAGRRTPRALGDFVLFYGARNADELAYQDEIRSYASSFGLRYLPTISRPHESPRWRERTGRVEHFFTHDTIAQTERAIGASIQPKECVVYVCGLKGTIQSVIDKLIPRGFVPSFPKLRKELNVPDEMPSSLFYEQYD